MVSMAMRFSPRPGSFSPYGPDPLQTVQTGSFPLPNLAPARSNPPISKPPPSSKEQCTMLFSREGPGCLLIPWVCVWVSHLLPLTIHLGRWKFIVVRSLVGSIRLGQEHITTGAGEEERVTPICTCSPSVQAEFMNGIKNRTSGHVQFETHHGVLVFLSSISIS